MENNKCIVRANIMAIEITRRCNMACAHCLRGDAQNLDIDPRFLRYIAKYVQPYEVVFTGGEPSLNSKAIDTYLKYAQQYGNFPSSFFIATNGKNLANQTKLAEVIMRWYPYFEESEMCQIDISRDMFHDACDIRLNPLTALRCYDPQGHVHNDGDYDWVINDGRAYETGWGYGGPCKLATNLDDVVNGVCGGQVEIEELYLSASGYIGSDCDTSFERMDEEHICHVSDFRKLVQDYIRKEKVAC